MLQFPRWRVDVTVGGDLVKTFYETATTSAAAIGKAKHKMRGAVSSAGAFKFKATKVEAGKPERHHATKAAPKSQREMYYDAERRSGEINKTFLEMLPTMRRRDLEKLIEKRPALWGRFAGYLTSGHVFVDDEPAKTRHHATMKASAKQPKGALLRNVSTPSEEKYQTWDGNVIVTNFKRGLWSVHPRGHEPFMVGSKREAFDQALGIASRKWGTK